MLGILCHTGGSLQEGLLALRITRVITFKTRISFKEHMKRGAHLLAPGPAGVEGRFVREIMLLLDGISVGGQSTREREGSPL